MTRRLTAITIASAVLSVGLFAGCSSSGSTQTSTPSTTSAPSSTASSSTASSSAPSSSAPSSSAPSSSAASSSATSSSAAPSTEPVVITIKDFEYSGPASVAPGATITVKNEDSANHTVTADGGDGAFDAKADGGGGTTTFTAPSKPGKYPYHCTFHGNMHGVLVVT